MDKIEEKTKLAFVGNSHIAFWALNIYFPQWECLNYGVPGEGLAYVEAFDVDTSDCQVVIQFGSNDIYQLNDENVDGYVERYVKAVLAVPSRQTYLFCIFPRNDYDDYSTSVNKFICMLITHRFPLNEIEEAYRIFENKLDGVIKVAIYQ